MAKKQQNFRIEEEVIDQTREKIKDTIVPSTSWLIEVLLKKFNKGEIKIDFKVDN